MRDWELEHPDIGWMERTGYPRWMQERDFEEDESPYEPEYGEDWGDEDW